MRQTQTETVTTARKVTRQEARHIAFKHEIKRVSGKFLEPPTVGDVFVNAQRETAFVPRYKIVRVNSKSARLRGMDTNLDFVVRFNPNAIVAVFKKVEQ